MVLVSIRRQWNDYKTAGAPFEALSGFRWDRISGGVRAPSPQPFIHAYVSCSDVDGEIAHSCRHGACPHRIKVVILKKDNAPETFQKILGIVGTKPK